MARKTQQEVNFWFQDNTVKSALDLSLIEKVLHNNNLDIPNNIIIHKNGNTYDDFARWYCDETKISKYPTSYVECCEVLGIGSYFEPEIRNATTEECYKFTKLMRLKRCCNAYWKIAGEEMGLDKPWEPDWDNYNEYKYCLYITENNVNKGIFYSDNHILAFPTEEMRDEFYENFNDLIESCKTLL